MFIAAVLFMTGCDTELPANRLAYAIYYHNLVENAIHTNLMFFIDRDFQITTKI